MTSQDKIEELVDAAAQLFAAADEAMRDWLMYRDTLTVWLKDVQGAFEGSQEAERLKMEIATNGLYAEQRFLRKAKRARRKAVRIMNRVTRLSDGQPIRTLEERAFDSTE